ncbi:MAG: hypothetical protein Q9213_007117 [Squamulea squamosa]
MEEREIQALAAQESGVIASDKVYFGPVTTEHYNTKNWQMTISKTTTKEIPLPPEPQDRRRQPGAPAFLRPTSDGHRLPGLFKILHTIPAAREALLSRGCIRSDYGRDSEWWNGVHIEHPQVVSGEEESEVPDKEIIYETQRLMAFLDATERAYGSTDALTALPSLRDYREDRIVEGFLVAWHWAKERYEPEADLDDTFTTLGVRPEDGFEPSNHDVKVLKVEVREDRFVSGQSLYEIIDSYLWPSRDGTEVEEQVFLDRVANVLIIQLTRGDGVKEGLDIKVPPEWYADRYRQSAQPRVSRMFAARTAVELEIRSLEARKAQIAQLKKSQDSQDISVVINGAKQYFKKTIQYLKETNGAEPAEPPQKRLKTNSYSKIADELGKISERVAKKLQELEDAKEQAQAKLRELSKLLTEPSDIPEESPQERYTLRGVCAKSHIIYVQERTKMETQEDMLDGDAEDWQWWKITYEATRQDPISCTKVRQIEVLKAVRDESPSAILVYASDKAMSVRNQELPPELTSFVQTDNTLFAAEIASASPRLPAITDHNIETTVESPNVFRPPPREPRSNDLSTEDSLPSYDSHRVFSPPPRGTYDDYIPTSLRHSSVNHMDLDLDEGVEMMERDGGVGGAFGASYGEDRKVYQLGDYEPEIEVEDREDREDEVKRRREGR